jgi:hypothetical protein
MVVIVPARSRLLVAGGRLTRHDGSSTTVRRNPPMSLPRTAQLSGLLGGVAWVVKHFLSDPDAGAGRALLWVGAVLLTVALFELGLLLVKGDVLVLRVFVALALPTLVWGVYGLVRSSASDEPFADAVFGGVIAVISLIQLVRRRERVRTTL